MISHFASFLVLRFIIACVTFTAAADELPDSERECTSHSNYHCVEHASSEATWNESTGKVLHSHYDSI